MKNDYEVTDIDGKYSIKIVKCGYEVELLRYGSYWATPTEAKAWISVAYELQTLREKINNEKDRTN